MSLSEAQERVALILLSAGGGRLVLGGGGALIAHGLVDRPSDDLDAFVDSRESFESVVAAVRAGLEGAGYQVVSDPGSRDEDDGEIRTWLVSRPRTSLRGRKPAVVKVQVVRDPIALPPRKTSVGPALDPTELGANKILTIYDRYRHRDYDDIARLSWSFNFDHMLSVADSKQVQPLDRGVLAQQFRSIDRLDPVRFHAEVDVEQLRTWCHQVAESLEDARPVASLTPPRYARPPRTPGSDGVSR